MFYDHWSILQPSKKGSTRRWIEYFLVFAAVVTAVAFSLVSA